MGSLSPKASQLCTTITVRSLGGGGGHVSLKTQLWLRKATTRQSGEVYSMVALSTLPMTEGGTVVDLSEINVLVLPIHLDMGQQTHEGSVKQSCGVSELWGDCGLMRAV